MKMGRANPRAYFIVTSVGFVGKAKEMIIFIAILVMRVY
jgi:hypothetical protein